MKICIFSDVHNNVIALEAVLQSAQEVGCDKYVCAGDIIGIGPYPEETVKRMMSIPNLIAVKGNHDRYLTDGMPSTFPNSEGMDLEEMRHHEWEHGKLSKESIEFLQSLPNCVRFSLCGLSFCVMHYCMNEKQEYVHFTPKPAERDLARMFRDIKEDVIIYGHNHDRCIVQTKKHIYINSGSLGCPSNENIARAAILDIKENKTVELTPLDIVYDVNKVISEIDKLQYPAYKSVKTYFYGVK